MSSIGAFVTVAFGLIFGAQSGSAQEMSHYRGYVLESSLESVVAASGVRAADVKTIHQRPAAIREFEWRAPYVSAERAAPDAVRTIAFSFYNDALYRIVVSYDRERTAGLTNNDVIASLAAVYGAPVAGSMKNRPAASPQDSVVLARWEDKAASVTLFRDAYSPEFQLIVVSKTLNDQAGRAIREAVRLDTIEAPRRDLERRKKDAADASAASEKARTENKAVFRP